MVSPPSQDAHHALPDAEALAWLRLLLTPGLGRTTARRLLASAGSADAVWQLPLSTWAECATQAQIKALTALRLTGKGIAPPWLDGWPRPHRGPCTP